MLGPVIIFGLLLGACYWITYPLLKENSRRDDFTPKPEDIRENLRKKKEGAYAVIRELEFDLSMGKLTEEDFDILRRQYLQEAAGYMKQMDKLESQAEAVSTSADANLEEENGGAVAAIRTPEADERKYVYCASCGRKAAAEDRFCVACGLNLHEHRGEK
jgi:hypothetical protein